MLYFVKRKDVTMSKKQIFISSVIAVILILIIVIICLILNFINSPRFGAYELTMAIKEQNSERAIKYYDIDKIVDNMIADATNDILKENTEFAALGISMMNNMKDIYKTQYKKNLIEEYETKSEKIDKMSKFKILYLAYTSKPVSADKLIYKKHKNTASQSYCSKDEKDCYKYTWEKIDKKWKITNFEHIKKN